ncbi:hypothetical protein [Mixta intestinalis]|jgi:hypothetical protein|uniref:Uncharacterized protein n=1 Tax=Mixta intestinalis TaxID=1615494 RepID=A0A6P1Q2V3_9GAMM|nr:hypothetical protein [Mixta intestinalis]QHM72487.1 hypothetical protein C7M51_02800 [Mixta intestinalis]
MISALLNRWRLIKAAGPPGKNTFFRAAIKHYGRRVKEIIDLSLPAIKKAVFQGKTWAKQYRGEAIRLIARILVRIIAERTRTWPVIRAIAEKSGRLMEKLR